MYNLQGCTASRLLNVAFAFIFSAVASSSAAAQTFLVGFEAGQRSDRHLNGVINNGYFGGISMSAVLAGGAGHNGAFLLPVSGEVRFSDKSYMDANAFGDAAVRAGPLTFGAGLAASWDSSPDIPDRAAGGSDGNVIVINPISFGYSGFGKLNIGPQGRLFVQGRYTMLPADYAIPYHTAELDQLYTDNNLKREDVTQKDSYSIRAAVGYTFSHFIVRAQMIQETWRYDRIYDNKTGAYDRDARIVSLGITMF